jgi:hypothetical protein
MDLGAELFVLGAYPGDDPRRAWRGLHADRAADGGGGATVTPSAGLALADACPPYLITVNDQVLDQILRAARHRGRGDAEPPRDCSLCPLRAFVGLKFIGMQVRVNTDMAHVSWRLHS